jgi:DNA-binding GntR family transcriptional regulator
MLFFKRIHLRGEIKMKPKYMIIYDTLTTQLEDGTYQAGDMLPTENELCEVFSTSRMTVNKVITMLVQEGKVQRTRGKGTFVNDSVVDKEIIKLTSFSEDMKNLGKKPGTKLLEYKMLYDVSSKTVKVLDLEEDDFVHVIKRIRTADGEPIALDIDYISSRVVDTINIKEAKESVYSYLEEKKGINMGYSDFEIKSVLADDEIAKHLLVQVGDPIIYLKHITFTKEGKPFEYCKTFYRADKYSFRVRSYR